MKKLLMLLPLVLMASCVGSDTAVAFAKRAHPECSSFQSIAHRNGSSSQTEVSMTCDGTKRSITVKCIHGWGIFADTTCHENN